MQNAATRMRRLIDDLLAFARVTSKAQPFTRVDLGAVAREVLSDLEAAIEQAGPRSPWASCPPWRRIRRRCGSSCRTC